MRIPSSFLRQQATLEPKIGSGSRGPIFGEPVELRCRFEASRRTIRRPDGAEVTCVGRVFVRPEPQYDGYAPGYEDQYLAEWPLESRVVIEGRTYTLVDLTIAQGLSHPSHLELAVA